MNKIKQFTEDIVIGASILANHGVGEWKRFLAEKKAQTGTIMAIVTGSITVLLGVIIFVNVKHAMPAVNDSTANATMDSVASIFYSAVGLVVIGFLVLAAVFTNLIGGVNQILLKMGVQFPPLSANARFGTNTGSGRKTPGCGRRVIFSPLVSAI